MTDKPRAKPLDLNTSNASENDRLHAATSIQSSVTPEEYPLKDREMQAEAASAAKPRVPVAGPTRRGEITSATKK